MRLHVLNTPALLANTLKRATELLFENYESSCM